MDITMFLWLLLTLITTVHCDECVRYTFGEDYLDTFDNVKNPCQENWYLWALKTYNDSTIERPNNYSEYYIQTITHTELSCVSSFNMWLSAGGFVEVNIYMMRTSYLDQFSAIVNLIDLNTGIGTVAGQANFQPIQDMLPVWHTLTIPVETSTSGLGYVSFVGIISGNESILIVDSFRYVPAHVHPEECELYYEETDATTTTYAQTTETYYTSETTDLTPTETVSTTNSETESTTNSETDSTTNFETDSTTIDTEPTTFTTESDFDTTTDTIMTTTDLTYESTTETIQDTETTFVPIPTTVYTESETTDDLDITTIQTTDMPQTTIIQSTTNLPTTNLQTDTTTVSYTTNLQTDLTTVSYTTTASYTTTDSYTDSDYSTGFTTLPDSTETDTIILEPEIQITGFWTPLTVTMVFLLCCVLVVLVALISFYIGRLRSQDEVFVETYFDIGDIPKLIILPRVRKVFKNINTNPYMNNHIIDNEF